MTPADQIVLTTAARWMMFGFATGWVSLRVLLHLIGVETPPYLAPLNLIFSGMGVYASVEMIRLSRR